MRRRFCKSEVKAQGSTLELLLKLHYLNPGEVSRIPSVEVKSRSSTSELPPILPCLRTGEEIGIHSGAVKCVDIVRNTSGEGESLDSS